MFIFDHKPNILINSSDNQLIFQSKYFSDPYQYFKLREFLEVDFLQLRNNPFQGYISKIITDQVMIELSQRNCLTKLDGITNSKVYFFAIPLYPSSIFLQNSYQLESQYIVIIPPNTEISVLQHPFSNRFHLYISDEYLDKICQTLHLPEPKCFLDHSKVSVMNCSIDDFWFLKNMCYQLYQILFSLVFQNISFKSQELRLKFIQQKLKKDLVKKLVLTLADAKDIKPKKIIIKRSSVLKRATEIMENNLRAKVTISDISQEIGVSQRTLEYIFKDLYEISPKDYFKKLRLNAFHQSLEQMSTHKPLHEIAEEFGFFHRGNLASDYKKMFGQLPSETLKK